MIVSAISLWKKFNLKNPLSASEWGIEEENGVKSSHVSYSGHKESDGSVRIYARYIRALKKGKQPAVLLLNDVGATPDEELATYFLKKGYAVLMPDYTGKMKTDGDGVLRTAYPPSLDYGNYEKEQGLRHMADLPADKTTWFEWAYVALYSIEFLKAQEEIGNIGIVGIRTGGEIAWHAMLSPHVKCGVPINAIGWRSVHSIAKFSDNIAHNLSDNRHRYIAATESQSYAPYVKCPVLMLCALHDPVFDCDRAYDTYSRIGNKDGNALAYSPESGVCIGHYALADMDLFLEKNLKGREIYIPDTLNISLKESPGGIEITVGSDKEGLLEEVGIYYAEGDVNHRCAERDWHQVFKTDGRSVQNGSVTHTVKPFAGASAAFAFAYAKYFNGFRVMSKISCKRLNNIVKNAVKSRMLFSGKEMDTFSVATHEEYSIGNIFLEREALPKITTGYGNIKGAYSMGGIKTYKIGSPKYVPEENALLEFDAYSKESQELRVEIKVSNIEKEDSYVCIVPIKGGGKWKRIILKAADFKEETNGKPLRNFFEGNALSFDCAGDEELEFSITNILWL
ncbi:MAG: dienelactone hydrolase family protein [Clostridia bacterium]|nr:dienelactone hydrolase family protein [Clostridia bacterium]